MVVGYHLIWTAYGWWLPNDPRGSSSHEIRVERIAELGELHQGRKVVQPTSQELRRFYEDARLALRHDLLTFSSGDMERVVRYIRENPVKAGQPVQEWEFVLPYDGWMPAYCG